MGCALIAAVLPSCGARAPDEAATSSPPPDRAALFVLLRDFEGKPVPSARVEIGQHGIGGMTDDRGVVRIADIPPGTWVVSWWPAQSFADSMGIAFVGGREETLDVMLRKP